MTLDLPALLTDLKAKIESSASRAKPSAPSEAAKSFALPQPSEDCAPAKIPEPVNPGPAQRLPAAPKRAQFASTEPSTLDNTVGSFRPKKGSLDLHPTHSAVMAKLS